jgi:hypothetical protein
MFQPEQSMRDVPVGTSDAVSISFSIQEQPKLFEAKIGMRLPELRQSERRSPEKICREVSATVKSLERMFRLEHWT